MLKVKRPKKVQRGQRNYLTNERYQDYSEQQFKNIYDALDDTNESVMNLEIEASEQIDMEALTNIEIENLLR